MIDVPNADTLIEGFQAEAGKRKILRFSNYDGAAQVRYRREYVSTASEASMDTRRDCYAMAY